MRVRFTALALALALAGCEDGSHVLTQALERPPVIPKPPTAVTTPVAAFSAAGTNYPSPADAYGAAGPSGLALIRTDQGESSSSASLEDSDAVVCDPDKDRVLLLKARAHQGFGTNPVAVVLATSVAGSLEAASAVIAVEPTTTTRRLLVATANGYTVLREDGSLVAAHLIQGAPFTELSLGNQAPSGAQAIFLASGTAIRRVAIDRQNEFRPVDQSVTPNPSTLIHTASANVNALFPGNNDDLLFCEANVLRRIPDSSSPVGGTVILTSFTFAGGQTARAVIVNSGGNAVVGVDTGAGGTLVEISLSAVNQAPGAEISILDLGVAPRDVAIDGAHASFTFSTATGTVGARLEPAPTIDGRILPILNTRGCVGCHPVVFAEINFTNGDTFFATMVNQPTSASCQADDNTPGDPNTPATLRVEPGDSANSMLIQKVRGLRDGSPGALAGDATCGRRMPFGLRPIPEVEIDTFRLWIDSGAAR